MNLRTTVSIPTKFCELVPRAGHAGLMLVYKSSKNV